MKLTFKAYDKRGTLVSHTWAASLVTQHVEKEMYQTLLNKGHYSYVDICSDDSNHKFERLVPNKALKG